MKHKYKVIHFVKEKQVCEWREEEIKPILYLNDYYNFLDTDTFENAYGHGKGSKNYIYEVLKKHLEALEIIKKKKVDVNDLLSFVSLKAYNEWVCVCDDNDKRKLTKEEYKLLKEVLL